MQEIDTYEPPSPAGAFLQVMLGVVFLLLVIVGLVAGWGTFLKEAPLLVQIIVVLVFVAVPGAVIVKGAKAVYLDIQHAKAVCIRVKMDEEQLRAMEATRARDDKLADAEAERIRAEAAHIRAEADKLLMSVPWDDQGNAALIHPQTGQIIQLQGQMRQYPALSSLNYRYDYKDTRVTEEQPAHLGTSITQPTQEWVLGQLPEKQLIVSPGLQAANGQLVKVSIVDVPHFKILGSTGFGKSCLAGSFIDQATQTNTPDVLQLACLDLEHKTSRLFEDLPHIATCRVGNRLVQMVATDADEVVTHFGYLKRLLDYRAGLAEAELAKQPVMFIYVEEMLSLQYEVVDPKQLKIMLADLTILSVRGRKYGLFLLACMQTDYSTDEMRISQKMFRFRAAAAIDQSAARAAGFQNTDLIKQNFAQGQPGQFVIEYPSFSEIVLAPVYDVKRLVTAKTRASEGFRSVSEEENSPGFILVKPSRNALETPLKTDETPLQAKFQEVKRLRSMGWGKVAIVEKVWRVKAGGTIAYKNACAEYDRMVEKRESEV